jgi:DNA-binding NtrC family response regulator
MLPHELRLLAERTQDKNDAQLLWRAANQLEILYSNLNLPPEESKINTLEAARLQGERKLLLTIIYRTNGNKSAVARRLNISRQALYKTLKKHKMEVPL